MDRVELSSVSIHNEFRHIMRAAKESYLMIKQKYKHLLSVDNHNKIIALSSDANTTELSFSKDSTMLINSALLLIRGWEVPLRMVSISSIDKYRFQTASSLHVF